MFALVALVALAMFSTLPEGLVFFRGFEVDFLMPCKVGFEHRMAALGWDQCEANGVAIVSDASTLGGDIGDAFAPSASPFFVVFTRRSSLRGIRARA